MKYFGIINFSYICIIKFLRKRYDKCEGFFLEKELLIVFWKIFWLSVFFGIVVSENKMKVLKKVIFLERKIFFFV